MELRRPGPAVPVPDVAVVSPGSPGFDFKPSTKDSTQRELAEQVAGPETEGADRPVSSDASMESQQSEGAEAGSEATLNQEGMLPHSPQEAMSSTPASRHVHQRTPKPTSQQTQRTTPSQLHLKELVSGEQPAYTAQGQEGTPQQPYSPLEDFFGLPNPNTTGAIYERTEPITSLPARPARPSIEHDLAHAVPVAMPGVAHPMDPDTGAGEGPTEHAGAHRTATGTGTRTTLLFNYLSPPNWMPGAYSGTVAAAYLAESASQATSTLTSFASSVMGAVSEGTESLWRATAGEPLRRVSSVSSPPSEGEHHLPPPSGRGMLSSRISDQDVAEHRKDLAFSFSPAGLLLPYHAGVIQYLLDVKAITDDVVVSGASAGAIAVACLSLGMPMHKLMQCVYRMEHDLRQHGTMLRLKKLLEQELDGVLPDNAHELANNRRQKAYVVYTQVMPWKGRMVSHFDSRKDFIECVLASCNIPFYFHKTPTIKCRNRQAVDGFFSDRYNFGCPDLPRVKRNIRVMPFPAHRVTSHLPINDIIAPDLCAYDYKMDPAEITAFQEYLRDNPAPPTAFSARPSRLEVLLESGPGVEPKPEVSPGVVQEPRAKLEPFPTGPDISEPTPRFPRTTEKSLRRIDGPLRRGDPGMMHTESLSGFESLLTGAPGAVNIPSPGPPELSKSMASESAHVYKRSGWRSGSKRSKIMPFFYASHRGKSEGALDNLKALEKSGPLPRFPEYDANAMASELRGEAELFNQEIAERSRRSSHGVYETGRRYERKMTLPDIPKKKFHWSTLFHYAMTPTKDDDVLRELFDLGRADAFRWHYWNQRLTKHGEKLPQISEMKREAAEKARSHTKETEVLNSTAPQVQLRASVPLPSAATRPLTRYVSIALCPSP